METLLSLTSKRAGEWFKEELRELGGLEHIVKTVVECSRVVDDTVTSWTPQLLDRLRKVDRCLRVLENVSFLFYYITYIHNINIFKNYRGSEHISSNSKLFAVTDSFICCGI